jgi:hypothetical protein
MNAVTLFVIMYNELKSISEENIFIELYKQLLTGTRGKNQDLLSWKGLEQVTSLA